MNTRKTHLIIALLISTISFAQVGINYSALVKDSNGNVLNNANIDVQFTIDVWGTVEYQEVHNTQTDANGIVNLIIGFGSTTFGTYSGIDWDFGLVNLNVQIDSGNGYVDLGTTLFKEVPFAIQASRATRASIAENVNGLQLISEGGNTGWRLIGQDPNNYGNIGFQATDLSYSNLNSTTYGATGSNSTTMGIRTTASGDSSLALGSDSTASEDFSVAIGAGAVASEQGAVSIGGITTASGFAATAMGYFTEASGTNSMATGNNTTASGDYSYAGGNGAVAIGDYSLSIGLNTTATGGVSTALGNNTTASESASTALGRSTIASGLNSIATGLSSVASGNTSFASGRNTVASGTYSTAMGNNTNAESIYSTAIGYYNVGGGSNSSPINANDPLFEIGNGNSITRSNAFTVLHRGFVGIGTHNPQERLHVADGRLRIGTETIEDGGNNNLRFNASLFPDNDDAMGLGSPSLRWVGVWSTDGTINTSDRREKKNIRAIKYGLEEVLSMNPVSFNWKNRNDNDTKLGLIAQDLQVLIPEVVKSHTWEKDEDTGTISKIELERLGVYYSDLVPVLIKAIQEQQKIIKNEQSKNAKQNLQLEALLSRIEQLESHSSN